MGTGYYRATDWEKLKKSGRLDNFGTNSNGKGFAYATGTFPLPQYATTKNYDDRYNARFVGVRESFDSKDSPESMPIILGFDATGSMGFLAEEIAKNSLNSTISTILAEKVVRYPHFMCSAFTNCASPLQVTQFEADIRIFDQLLDFRLGGGNSFAYDDVLWYFAAKHTNIDSLSKRNKKGILIGIGDERYGGKDNTIRSSLVTQVFSDACDRDYDFYDCFDMVREKYVVIHIVVGDNSRFDNTSSHNSYEGWKKALPGHVAKLDSRNIKFLDKVLISIIKMINGQSKDAVLNSIEDKEIRDIVSSSIEDMDIKPNELDMSFVQQRESRDDKEKEIVNMNSPKYMEGRATKTYTKSPYTYNTDTASGKLGFRMAKALKEQEKEKNKATKKTLKEKINDLFSRRK